MQFKYTATGLAIVLSLAGCQRTTYNHLNTPMSPAPLQAQPVPTVQSGQLPDPTTSSAQFPDKPMTTPGVAGQPNDTMAASAMDVTKEAMVGNWRVSGAGNCDMFLTLTNLGSGSRGGTRGCSGELTAMGSWEVSGKQVLLKDRDGNVIGRVYKTADSRFDGTTNSGQSVSLSR